MKKISLLLLLSLSLLIFNSCENDDKNNSSFTTIISAGQYEFDLGVVVNTSGSISIDIYSNDIVSSDRTFNINLSEDSTGSSSDYSVPSSFTIPANSNKGILTINAEDVSNTLILYIEEISGVIAPEPIIVNILKVCPFSLDDFVGTYAAVEDGLYNYDVTVTKGAQPNQLVLVNLYEAGGTTIINVSTTEDRKVTFPTFPNGGVLYVSGTYGNVYAVNPSAWSAHVGKDTSSLNVCETKISLAFVRQVSAGIFSTIINVEMTKN
jgi:hypothetical protein